MQAAPTTAAPYAAQAPRLPAAAAVPLSPGQAAALAAWGVFLWFAAALLIRWAPPVLFGRGVWTALLFAAALPNAWLTIWATRRLFSLQADQLVPAAALASAVAMLCDGVALTWATLYGLAVTSMPKMPIWKLCNFNAVQCRLCCSALL